MSAKYPGLHGLDCLLTHLLVDKMATISQAIWGGGGGCGWGGVGWVGGGGNTLRPRQNNRCLVDDIFQFIFFNENWCILVQISLKYYFSKGPTDNNPALVQSGLVPIRAHVIIRTCGCLVWWRRYTSFSRKVICLYRGITTAGYHHSVHSGHIYLHHIC